jgi:hypothetical protein
MEGEAFARQMSAWLDPMAVIETARLCVSEPEVADATATWTWSTPQYGSARDVGLDTLVTRFLEHFRLAPQYVRLLRHSWEEPIPDEIWDRLASLSFCGGLSFDQFPADAREDTVVWLSDTVAMISVLRSPLEFLANYVGQLANTWLNMAAQRTGLGPEVWLEHSSPAELFVYIESVVASACGIEPTVAVEGRGQNIRYAAVGAVGDLVPDQLEAVRETARTYAATGYPGPALMS